MKLHSTVLVFLHAFRKEKWMGSESLICRDKNMLEKINH
jgi:hypothetical protein